MEAAKVIVPDGESQSSSWGFLAPVPPPPRAVWLPPAVEAPESIFPEEALS